MYVPCLDLVANIQVTDSKHCDKLAIVRLLEKPVTIKVHFRKVGDRLVLVNEHNKLKKGLTVSLESNIEGGLIQFP